MKNKLQRMVLRGAVLALSIFSIMMNLMACGKRETEPPVPDSELILVTETTAPAIPANAVEYEGKYYVPREDLQTILIMGLDKDERPESTIAYTNKLQADFLMLLIIDEEAQVCDVLHLNRDTMTEIRRLGIGGGETGTFVGQLALAHTYGSGGSDSCLNAVKAVSNLLGGVAIDHYMTLTMDAVGKINDMVGGVTVTMLEDFTEFDPAMEKGAELTLMGDQALAYVRFRMTIGDGLNVSRMERQEQYLSAFYTKLMEKNQEDDDFLAKALMNVNDAFMSDLTVNQLDKLGETMAVCQLNPFQSLAGKTVKGEEYYEYHVDAEKLQETVISLFYEEMIA